MAIKQSWEVEMECIVRKIIITDKCTKEEAQNNPWDHAEDEREIMQVDWEVLSVKPND